MHNKEAGQLGSEDVKKAYSVAVEGVIIELLQASGIPMTDKEEAKVLMERLSDFNGSIHRHVTKPFKDEFITLASGDVVTHVAHVFLDGDRVVHIVMTADEMREAQNNGS